MSVMSSVKKVTGSDFGGATKGLTFKTKTHVRPTNQPLA
jgi:hypothetical protein